MSEDESPCMSEVHCVLGEALDKCLLMLQVEVHGVGVERS